MKYKRKLSSVVDSDLMHSATPHLLKIDSSVKISKSLLSNFTASLNPMFRVQLLDNQLLIESSEDIIPMAKGYDRINTLVFQHNYRFRYRLNTENLEGMDKMEDEVYEKIQENLAKENKTVFQTFIKESIRFSIK